MPTPVASPTNTSGDLEYTDSGVLTAVDPGACTVFTDGTNQTMSGFYRVTATYDGMTSQPIYIALTSAIPASLPDASGNYATGGCPFNTKKSGS